ncbi:MAG: ATP-binding protein [Bacteroidetes bacterium]|nr:ATP-binding protein [Bacteroidota bacterium]
MQKLEIKKQFMGVKPCEIELKRMLLLIGEQASGKSTIAKLIFFFQTLPDAIIESVRIASARKEQFEFQKHISYVVRDKFYETFGSTYHHTTDFDLSYYFGKNRKLRVYRNNKDKRAYAEFDKLLGQELTSIIDMYFRQPQVFDRGGDILRRQQLLENINSCFLRNNSDFNYIIAGRNLSVGFPEIFEGKVRFEIEKIMDDEVKRQDLQQKRRIGNERLLLSFVEWAEDVRIFFKNNGGSFESAAQVLEQRQQILLISKIAEKILKGKYDNDAFGEVIRINSNEKIFLKDASSGQQEVLRVLQGLFLSIGLKNRKDFFVIEEPEAHLYPLAQKELINAFAVFLNSIPQGRLIITTHSPYILACVNILLMASYVALQSENGQKKQVSQIVSPNFWLNSDEFTAYSVGHLENYCKSIKDTSTGLVDQNYLDLISEQLGIQYQQLYEILS